MREVLQVPDTGWGSQRGPSDSEKVAILLSKVEGISAGDLGFGGGGAQAKICAENPSESVPFLSLCLACLPRRIPAWPLCLSPRP